MAFIDLNGVTRKTYFSGTHRSRPPAETLADYSRFMPIMGITRLANITGLDHIGLPVVVSVRPNSRSLATSQGKGETLDAAKASALMESIESWHGERIAGPLLYESYEAMRRHALVADVAELPQMARTTYYPNRPIPWIEGFDLMSEQPMWVPFETVTTNFVSQPGYSQIFGRSSNGLASGNSFVEAICHGLCEVIERDAMSLWALLDPAEQRRTQVALDSIVSPSLIEIIAKLKERGVVLAVWDMTTDIGVPTYVASIAEHPDSPHWRSLPMANGYGTHLAPEIAMSRAIHEAIQTRLTLISGSRDDILPSYYIRVGTREDDAATLRTFTEPPPTFPFSSSRPEIGDYFEADLRILLKQLQSVGIKSVVAVDLSRPEIGIPVVKIVVPGLETLSYLKARSGRRGSVRRQQVTQ